MKTPKLQRLLSVLIIPTLVLFAACSDPVEDLEDDETNTSVHTSEEADQISDSFAFINSVKVTGTVPTVANSSLVKTDSKDTIYTIPGLKIPLRVSHPAAVAINGWFIVVKNSTFYYDVPIHEEEDSDTVSVIFLEIDPGDVDFPYHIPVEITPYDQNKLPVDVIERIITVEDPASGGCDILVSGDTSNIGPPIWMWFATVVFNSQNDPTFVNTPNRMYGANQKVVGCCDEVNCPQAIYNPVTKATELVYDTELDAATMYSIEFESFTFFQNGTFERHTMERIKNFNYEATEWCAGITGYIDRESYVEYYGTHNYAPGNASISYATLSSACADPMGICGYGSRGGALEQSCHMMIITAGVEASKEVRMYTRHSASYGWYD